VKPRLLDIFCGAGGCSKGYQRAGFFVVGVDINPMPRYCGDEFHQGDALEYLRDHGHEFDTIHASPPCQAYCSLKGMPNAKKHLELVEPCRDLLEASGKLYVIENVPGAPMKSPTILCGTMFGLGTGDADLRRHRLFETNWPLVIPFGMFCKHGRRAASRADTIGIYGTDGRGRSVNEMWARKDEASTICVIGQRGIAENRALRRSDFPKPRTISLFGKAGVGRDDAANKRSLKTITVVGRQGQEPNAQRDGLLYFSTAERNEAMGITWMKGGEISQAIPPAYTNFIGLQLIKLLSPQGKE
jgi:hypothetical protein